MPYRVLGLARSHCPIEWLHETTVDVAVIGRVDSRWILLVRVLSVGGGDVHYTDGQLTRLVHKTTKLSRSCRLVHVTRGRLSYAVAVGRLRCHEVRVDGNVGTYSTRRALHLRTATARVERLPVEALTGIGLAERRHRGARRGP